MAAKQKKLMLLGGLRYLLPVIEAAHRLGYYVITCDYIPDNIAHKYSDEYHNVSIIDKDAVLELARQLEIDGIMSFAVDPGVVTAAYVAEKMGLPGNPYKSVCILQSKDSFRSFLKDNGFVVPEAYGFASVDEAMQFRTHFKYPVIVKPTDAAGSKGVSKVEHDDELHAALEYAMTHSLGGHIIVEDFIEKEGCSSDTDSFSVDGELKFVSFSAQRFDADATNPYTPSAYSWPSTFSEAQEAELKSEIQRLLKLLGMRTSIYNIETRIGTDGRAYIMEVSPRGGGNRLAEMLKIATGVDLVTAAVKASVGEPVTDVEQKPYNCHLAEIILHADRDGEFDDLAVAEKYQVNVVERDLWVKSGDAVHSFEGANNAIGTLVMKFDTKEELEYALSHQREWLEIRVK